LLASVVGVICLDHSATGASIRSDLQIQHNRDVLVDNSTTSLVCILRHLSLCVPTGCYGSPWLSVRHHGRTSSCRAGSPYGILLVRNRKYPSMVGYPGYLFTPRIDLDTSMPQANPVHKDSGSLGIPPLMGMSGSE